MKTWRSFLLSGALLAAIPSAFGQPACTEQAVETTSIKRAEIVHGDLVVDILWSSMIPHESLMTIQVLDRGDNIVASSVVRAEPGTTVSYPLTDGPAFFAQNGYWFTVRIVDFSDEAQTTDLPFLVSPCPSTESCIYSVVEGIGSDTVAMDRELFDLLDRLEAEGARDLLGEALLARPDLTFEVYVVADQMDRLLRDKAGSECVCQWTVAYSRDSVARSSSRQTGDLSHDKLSPGNPDSETFSHHSAGSRFYLAGQILGGERLTLSTNGYADIGLHLRCRAALAWEPVVWTQGQMHFPTLLPCSRACEDARINVTASAQSLAAANAWATSQDGARGLAFASASLFLSQHPAPVVTTIASAEADRRPGDPAQEMLLDAPDSNAGQWMVAGTDASATYMGHGSIEICLMANDAATNCQGTYIRPEDDRGPWAFGCATANANATLHGEASCAFGSQAKVSLRGFDPQNTQDGLLIVPWNP